MEEISWQTLATLPGAVAGVTLLLTILKAIFGIYWTELINRFAALGLSVAAVVGTTAYLGTNSWAGYMLAAFNGIIVAGALLGVTKVYNQKVIQDRTLGLTKENFSFSTVSQEETKKILSKAKSK
jgi:hypothetical protein